MLSKQLLNQKNRQSVKHFPIKPIETDNTNANMVASPKKEYSLNHNFFDPNELSPPNHFLLKIYERINKYDSSVK